MLTDLCDGDDEQVAGGKLVQVHGAAHHSHWAHSLALEVHIHPAQQKHTEKWT